LRVDLIAAFDGLVFEIERVRPLSAAAKASSKDEE